MFKMGLKTGDLDLDLKGQISSHHVVTTRSRERERCDPRGHIALFRGRRKKLVLSCRELYIV